jgi:hypothetical protein
VDNDGNALVTGALYFNTTNNEMRVWNGAAWQTVASLPDVVVQQNFVATAGQTSATFTAGYRVGFLYVYVNGVLLYTTDITATDGSTVTFASALSLNDEVRMITFKAAGSLTAADVDAVPSTGATGSAEIPTGTEAQRDGSPSAGYFRFNTDVAKFEGYNGTTWGSVGGGATGGGSDDIFVENGQTVTTNYTITTNKNAMSAGPITVDSGVTVTVPSGSVWTIV